MTSRRLIGVALGASVLLCLPLGITATTASWNDAEWAYGAVGTSSLRCGTDTGFTSTSSGRFLSGELLGVDLDPIADLEEMTLALAGDGALTVDPPDAVELGAAPPTYANPFDLSLLGGIVGVDLTGFSVPLPGASLGAANQYAQVAPTGVATGASGLVNDSGAVLVDQSTPSADLPAPATVSLTELLPAVAGIAGAELQVGAVGASARLDGCAALRSALWGDGSVTGITRDYGIAGLGMQLDSPAVAGLIGTVTSGITTITAAVNALTGTSGLISTAVGARIDLALPGVLTTGIGGTVAITGLDLGGAVTTLLNTPLTDGVVTIDLQTGAIDVDLDALLPSLNDAPPNTQIVLNAAVLNPIVTRVGTLLNSWSSQIVAALTQELRDAAITIDLTAIVRAPGVPILAPTGLDIIDVDVDFTGTVGQILAGTAVFTVTAEAIGAVGLINSVLSALGLPTLTALINTILGLGPALVTQVANTITTTVLSTVTTLGTTLSTAITAIITSVGGVVNALPTVLSVMVNVQPDQPGAPPGSTPVPATPDATPQYLVSALRIGLADVLVPADVAHVVLGTASAGPVTVP